jgi:hypothetical protein
LSLKLFQISLTFVRKGWCTFRCSAKLEAGNTKGGSITVLLTSCLTGLDLSFLQIKTKNVRCHTADSKPVNQEVNCTMILTPLVFPVGGNPGQSNVHGQGQGAHSQLFPENVLTKVLQRVRYKFHLNFL